MSRFASLASRLVVTAVSLVAVAAVLIGLVTTLAMRSYLTERLDDDVQASVQRASNAPPGPRSGLPDRVRGEQGRLDVRNQAPGTIIADLPDDRDAQGEVLTQTPGKSRHLSRAALEELSDVPSDGRVRQVDLHGVGTYRVAAVDVPGSTLLTGMPTTDVDGAVSSLVEWELLLGALAVLTAGGAGLLIVRRQLRPLNEVAATAHRVSDLPLSSGRIDLSERVPGRLTDERSEVGQVGAALNTLLEHVENSLEARHRSEQQVRQFVGDASHELRTPLATIKGYAELARRQPEDAEAARSALHKVEIESTRMTGLVEDLLLLARLDSGRPLGSERVDLTRLLLETVADARVLSGAHQWRLDLPEAGLEVRGDEQRLHQVVTNLLNNARKYTPPGTTVTVRARAAEFSVHDDGPGFPDELLESAFDRFVRGDASRTRGADDGAGLGLSLVRAIVAAHGGVVELSSRAGDTTVTVRLPT